MSLNVQYVIDIVEKTKDLNIEWWEEVLHPDDVEGFALLKRAHPTMKFTTGEVRHFPSVKAYILHKAVANTNPARILKIRFPQVNRRPKHRYITTRYIFHL